MIRGDAQRNSDPSVLVPGRISVIMPSFNAGDTIAHSIDCVLNQTYADVELLVVDDGSSDKTVQIVAPYVNAHPGRVQMLAQSHRGPYPARNLALACATGEYIAFLDADDTWSPQCLFRLFQAITSGNADIAYCGWQNVGPAAPGAEPFVPPAYEAGDPIESFLRSCPWPIHAALTRRSAIDAIGGFSERLFTSMDYDLWLRLIAHTRKITRVAEVMAFYHWRGNQISSDRSRQVLDAVQVRRDFIEDHASLLTHLAAEKLNKLTHGFLRDRAYEALWKRDSRTAQRLLRAVFKEKCWDLRDLPYIAIALLPLQLFETLLKMRDKA